VNLTLTIFYGGATNPSPVTLSSGGYLITQSAGAAIVPGITDAGNHGDDITTAISLPFSYTFYGQTFTNASLSSTGNLQSPSGNGNSATVGAQKDTGSSFTQFECNSGGLSNGLHLTFQSITCPDGGGGCGGPMPDFTANPTNGLAPLPVSFTNLSTGATNYIW